MEVGRKESLELLGASQPQRMERGLGMRTTPRKATWRRRETETDRQGQREIETQERERGEIETEGKREIQRETERKRKRGRR